MDYIRASVPTTRALELAAHASVEAASLDGAVFYDTPTGTAPPPAAAASSAQPVPVVEDVAARDATRAKFERMIRGVSVDSPLAPVRDMGLPQFWREHPSYDGRGATIAILEGAMDFTQPEFRTALTLDGRETRKIIGYHSPADYRHDDPSPSWVPMNTSVEARNGSFEEKQRIYNAPHDGPFRLGFLDERPLSYFNSDLDRDGNPEASAGLFAVLWDEASQTIRVDTNRDLNFRDEQALSDGWRTLAHGSFGPRDDPQQQVHFIAHPHDDPKLVVFGFLSSRHTTMVASVAAGRKLFGTDLSGAAPNAQLLLVGTAGPARSPIEAALYGARDPRVDVLTLQLASDAMVNDGRTVPALVMSRISRRYNKLIFASAGNDADILNVVDSRAAGNGLISIGMYRHAETVRAVLGRNGGPERAADRLSASGPSESGAIKPDLLAPSLGLAVNPPCCGKLTANTPAFPPGVDWSGGTSAASPYAAGAAAVLVSAARQHGITLSAARLRAAIFNSATFIDGEPANRQGRGLVNVPAAWRLLERPDEPIEIAVQAPVRTVFSHLFPTPHVGEGLFEREGWEPGDKRVRRLTLERSNGGEKPLRLAVRIVGNDGTFAAPGSIDLPLQKAVTLPVIVEPQTNGLHSALLQLYDAASGSVVQSVGLNVVAAYRLSARTPLVEESAEVGLPQARNVYVSVPQGTEAFAIELEARGTPLQFKLGEPTGSENRLNYALGVNRHRERPPSERADRTHTASQAVPHPTPGVWQIRIEGEDPDAEQRVPFRLRVRLSALQAEQSRNDIRWTNVGARTGRLELRAHRANRQDHSERVREASLQRAFEIDVPSGSRFVRVSARLGATQRTPAIVSMLSLLDCSEPRCVLRQQASGSGGTLTVTNEAPAKGRWVAVVDRVSTTPLAAALQVETLVALEDVATGEPAGCGEGLRTGARCWWPVAPGAVAAGNESRGPASVTLVEVHDRSVVSRQYRFDDSLKVHSQELSAPIGSVVLAPSRAGRLILQPR